MKKKILIVDDEVAICELLKLELELEGYECELSHDGKDAIRKFTEFKPNLIILDIMLPELDGISVCEKITSMSNIAVIMLSAKTLVDEKIDALSKGADDYMTKPFDTGELLARIKALLRRYEVEKGESKVISNNKLVLDLESKSATVEGKQLKLTATEFEILTNFMKNKNRVFTREDIASVIRLREVQIETRAIDMHIQRLRKKISLHTKDEYIVTIFKTGYKLKNYENDETER